MVFSFARIGAALGMKVEDVFTQNTPAMGAVAQQGRRSARLPSIGSRAARISQSCCR
jgi:hypothetical protein